MSTRRRRGQAAFRFRNPQEPVGSRLRIRGRSPVGRREQRSGDARPQSRGVGRKLRCRMPRADGDDLRRAAGGRPDRAKSRHQCAGRSIKNWCPKRTRPSPAGSAAHWAELAFRPTPAGRAVGCGAARPGRGPVGGRPSASRCRGCGSGRCRPGPDVGPQVEVLARPLQAQVQGEGPDPLAELAGPAEAVHQLAADRRLEQHVPASDLNHRAISECDWRGWMASDGRSDRSDCAGAAAAASTKIGRLNSDKFLSPPGGPRPWGRRARACYHAAVPRRRGPSYRSTRHDPTRHHPRRAPHAGGDRQPRRAGQNALQEPGRFVRAPPRLRRLRGRRTADCSGASGWP